MPSDPLHPRLLEVHEVAYQLKSSQETVLRLIRKGRLAAIRLGTRSLRIDPRDLEAFIESRRLEVAQAERALDARLRSGGDG
jgi:excisionase family DNA binding protein